nr:MAG TPA: hypothetical protein [Caudoviricetes sp.]
MQKFLVMDSFVFNEIQIRVRYQVLFQLILLS